MRGRYQIKRLKRYCWDVWINTILASYFVPIRIRKVLLNIAGAEVEGSLHGRYYLASSVFSLGKNSYINRCCIIDNGAAKIEIGDNVAIGYNVSFYTTNHDFSESSKRGGDVYGGAIVIKDGVWIGANTIILPGAIIHAGCVIAAGSIVRSRCEENCLYAGAPAQLKRRL